MNISTAFVPLALVCTLPLLAHAQAPAEEGKGPRYTVVPFAALTGDVPPRAGHKAAGMLATELKNSDAVRYAELKQAAAPVDPFADSLGKARAQVEEAKAAQKARKFRVAEEKLKAALEAYRAHAGGLTDVAEVQDAYAQLAAVQFLTGRDDEGQKSLQAAVGLAPKRNLPLAGTSRLFAKVVDDTRAALAKAPKGLLQVESQPQGAQVWVDGLLMGRTPLRIKDVPPGPHLWKVGLPTGTNAGGLADVAADKTAKVSAKSEGSDAESKLLSALAQNKVDDGAVTAARELGKSAEADVVLIGGLTRDGKGLALDPFTVDVATGELRRLPRRSFDNELLNAGMELFNLTGELVKSAKAGEPVKTPASVARTGAPPTATLAEARYGVPLRTAEELAAEPEEAVQEAPAKEERRAPLEPAKKRTPLKRP